MHELSLMQSILDIAIEHASKNNANIIKKINLEIGELSGFVPDWMQSYFDLLSEGTIAYKAEIVIKWIPVMIRCKSCGREYQLSKSNYIFKCSTCDSFDIEILSGREYYITSIEVD